MLPVEGIVFSSSWLGDGGGGVAYEILLVTP